MTFEDISQSMNIGIISEGLSDLSPLTIAQLGRYCGDDTKQPVLFLSE